MTFFVDSVDKLEKHIMRMECHFLVSHLLFVYMYAVTDTEQTNFVFVCLGFNDSAYLWQWYFDQCVAKLECLAADTGHDTPPCHKYSIQTQGRPVMLSTDVERHTGINNYPFLCLGSDSTMKSFPDLPHTTSNAQLYDAVLVVVSQELGRKCTTEPWTREFWCLNPLRYPFTHSCSQTNFIWDND